MEVVAAKRVAGLPGRARGEVGVAKGDVRGGAGVVAGTKESRRAIIEESVV